MIARYRPNEQDQNLIYDLTQRVRESLAEWSGIGSSLDPNQPEVRSYRNSFMLRYLLTTPAGQKKGILVKIRRNPKMDSLTRAIQADIHQNIPQEYASLQLVYSRIPLVDENLGAIRPLAFFEDYQAILMEEYPSRTLRQLLDDQRSSGKESTVQVLRDACWKTGRWLDFFHHNIHTSTEMPYTSGNILEEVEVYAERIEASSQGRVHARTIVEAFAKKLESLKVERMEFSQSHLDMTIDNVLYSDDFRVCIIDIKSRLAPVYADLGLLLVHPQTTKPEIFSGGRYYPDSLLGEYRAQITAGFLHAWPGREALVGVYSAIMVLDKWLMYEDLLKKYKRGKRLLAIPARPLVSRYFNNLLQKQLNLIREDQPEQTLRMESKATNHTL